MPIELGNVSTTYLSHIAELEKARVWLGSSIGRASEYGKLIRRFFEGNRRSTRHIRAYNESCEIIDIYELWHSRVDEFPGIFEKIRGALLSGTILQEEEDSAAASNRPRNEVFTYLLAGELLRAGLQVVAVDGIAMEGVSDPTDADVALELRKQRINIECKRPRAFRSLAKRANEAYGQLRSNPASFGFVAIDCSPLVRRPRTLIEAGSAEEASQLVTRTLEETVLPEIPEPLSARILGIGLFTRVPAMVRRGQSNVLAPTLRHYVNYTPYSVSSWLFAPCPLSADKDLFSSLRAAISSQQIG